MNLSFSISHEEAQAYLRAQRVPRVADWHGQQAAKAYRARNMKAFIRHTRIADRLWNAR